METKSFEFSDYLLDTRERVLLRQGEPVAITPKTFQLLRVLVENHGHIVEKEEIIRSVWADSFVEDGNLAFTMRLLRKALEDTRQNPRFIETVPRRGYRFIAEVKEPVNGSVPTNGSVAAPPEASEIPAPAGIFVKFLVPAALILLIGTIVAGFWLRSGSSDSIAPILVSPFSSEKLSTDGKAAHAVISRNGQMVVYTNAGAGKQSIWLRQLDSSNNVELIRASGDVYAGLALSPDGNFLYFSRRPRNVEGQANIYRVPIFGGVPTQIVAETQGWISISPDGAKVSFVRCYYLEEENCSLWMADAPDGGNERKLAARPRPIRIADNKFSPDGRTIAFAAGQSENAANGFGLYEVDLESGVERELTPEKFFNIKSIAWLPDRRGLIFTARRNDGRTFRIWQISSVSGEVLPLTQDAETYSVLSLNTDATKLVTTQVKAEFGIVTIDSDDPSRRLSLVGASAAAFASSGKLVYSSSMSGNEEIWSINVDGTEQRQLTNDPGADASPVVAPDNRAIFFASNRSGEIQVWRTNPDGSNQVQLTHKEGGTPLSVSPDGHWVYYISALKKTLWRVSANGGDESLVLDRRKNLFAFSPDGVSLAYAEPHSRGGTITLMSLADRKIFKTITRPPDKANLNDLIWLPDGKALAYFLSDAEYENNTLWIQPLDGGAPRKIADLGDESVRSLSASPDGKSFAIIQGEWKHDVVLLTGLK